MTAGLWLGWLLVAFVSALVLPRPAGAFAHLWRISEVFSNSDGTVQFIEMFSESTGENSLSFMFLRSAGSVEEFHFPSDLVGNTANQHLLVATAAFAEQPGAVTPDFVVQDGFLRISGDTLTFWNESCYGGEGSVELLWDSFAFGAGELPIDGIRSIHRDGGVVEIASNSPTNFAGETGGLAVPEPASALLLGAGITALGLARRASAFS